MMMLICLSCILQELTHIPQPLTALQTPLKEGGNFPFQVGLEEKKKTSVDSDEPVQP